MMPVRFGSRAIVVFVLVGLVGSAARAATPAEVEAALERGKKYIYSQYASAQGNWEKSQKRMPDLKKGQDTSDGQWGGLTALSVFALLASGENPQEERLAKGIEFLKKADLVGTYAIGVRCQVMYMLPPTSETKAVMARDMKKLQELRKVKGHARGFYDYTGGGGATSHSLSRSQYAVLGMWAAAQSGQEVPGNYWSEIDKAWTGAQQKDGGWRYSVNKADPPVTAGITAVGVATMFIVQDQLYSNRGIDCTNPMEVPSIERGIDWMSKNFDKVANETPYPRDFPYATLYAVERVGVAGGLKYFGTHDWYAKGSTYLVKRQRKDGSWSDGFPGPLPNTCFGVVFLSRGRAPVIVNKLDYTADDKSAGGAWNRRPRDVANLTRWIARTSERDFNWQIMNLDAPLVDWHDAPILYLSGSDPMKIGKEHAAKLRQYCDEGGMILVHADCGKGGFVGSARKLASELFPSYELRELPESHALYTTLHPRSKWKNKPSVLGVSNGVRELMLLIPAADPGKAWQIGATRGKEEVFQLGANIVFYAADTRAMGYKGEGHLVADDPNAKTSASINVARLRYKGNWDPEPGGWRRLRNLLRRDDKLDPIVTPVDLGTGSLEGVKVAHLTGTGKLKLDDAATAQLKKFVAGGGTLLVDAAGGSEAFASSVEPDLEKLGTGAKLELLPPDHTLFGGKNGLKVAYRPFVYQSAGSSGGAKAGVPKLKAVRVGDRPAVLFSREDLSGGLVGSSVGGVFGYQPATATDLVRRVVLKAAGLTPASTQPAKSETKAPATSDGKAAPKSDKPKAPPKPTFDDTGLD